MVDFLSRSVVVTDADLTLTRKSVRPEAADVGVGLGQVRVGDEEPGAKDGFGENVENGVGDYLAVDAHVSGSVRDAPDTA